MPVQSVPQGATPGLLNPSTLIQMDSICDVGSRAGSRDGSVGAWVNVTILPVGNAAGTGPVTPDAWGRFLHVCIQFVQPAQWRGKRRRGVPNWDVNSQPNLMQVECDPGWFWIGTQARFCATGGVAGDRYNITMTEATMRQESDARLSRDDPPFYQVDLFEDACRYRLTSLSTSSGGLSALPGIADHHSLFRLVNGTATWGGARLDPGTAVSSKWVPTNAPITVGVNAIYQTGGGV